MIPPVSFITNAAQAFLARLKPREQILVAVAAVLGIGVLGYTQVWHPLQQSRAKTLAEIARMDAAMLRVRAAGDQLVIPSASQARPLPTVIAETAPRFALPVQRIEPEGARTRVLIDTASVDALLRWIADIEANHGAIVVVAEIERRPEPGSVSADLTLER